MTTTDDSAVALSSEELTTLCEVLRDHDVGFAMVFGPAGRQD